MALNTITIEFEPCEPTPSNGYKISYRPVGSDDDYREWPNVFDSPAVITDDNDPAGTDYEGIIQSDCAGNLGAGVPWSADNDQSVSGSDSGSESDGSEPVEEFGYYLAERVRCEDCEIVDTDVLVRLPISETVEVGKFYRPVGHPTGFVYTLDDTPQSPASSVELTGENFTTCGGACSG